MMMMPEKTAKEMMDGGEYVLYLHEYLKTLTELNQTGVNVMGEINATTKAINIQLGIEPKSGGTRKNSDGVTLTRKDVGNIADHLANLLRIAGHDGIGDAKSIKKIISPKKYDEDEAPDNALYSHA